MFEETGYDIGDIIKEDDNIEMTIGGKQTKLYIVVGIDPDVAQFAPKCRGVSTVPVLLCICVLLIVAGECTGFPLACCICMTLLLRILLAHVVDGRFKCCGILLHVVGGQCICLAPHL